MKNKGPSRGRNRSSRYQKPFASDRRQYLTLAQMAEMKQSEATINAIQKREGTKHPTTAIVWGCRCCYGYTILTHQTIADTTVQEEDRKRKSALAEEIARLTAIKKKYRNHTVQERLDYLEALGDNIKLRLYQKLT